MRIRMHAIALLVLASLVYGVVGYVRPDLYPAGPMHPRSIVHGIRGETLHPWVRLDADQKYVVHFWDVKWPIFRKELLDYETYLEYVTQGFMANHANVRVEVRLFDLTTDEEYLKHAINSGERPDVISAPFGEWFLERGLLADLSLMVDKGMRDKYVTSALSSVTKNQRIWAYPRWLDLHCLLGNASVLKEKHISPDLVASPLWTWERFGEEMARSKRPGLIPFVLNTIALDGLEELVDSTGGGKPLDPKGAFCWTAKDLEPALAITRALQQKGILEDPPGKNQGSILENIWGNRAVVYGPFGSGLLRHIRERKTGLVSVPAYEKGLSATEVALLPVPRNGSGQPPLSAGLVSLLVLKNEDPKQMLAAARFAEYMSTGHFPKVTEALQVVSAYKPNIDATLEALIASDGKAWVRDCLNGQGPRIGQFDMPLCPPEVASLRRLDGAVRAFWARPTTPEALLESLHRAFAGGATPPKPNR